MIFVYQKALISTFNTYFFYIKSTLNNIQNTYTQIHSFFCAENLVLNILDIQLQMRLRSGMANLINAFKVIILLPNM